NSGANAPCSPTAVVNPRSLKVACSAWKTSVHQRRASLNEGAATGKIMNSWKAIGALECDPPFTIFIIGVGNWIPPKPPKYCESGKPEYSAAARATAIETPKMALAPKL